VLVHVLVLAPGPAPGPVRGRLVRGNP
jgi:hypothetical protein